MLKNTKILLILIFINFIIYAQDMTTMITPHNPPVRIPVSGGYFDYMVDAANNDSNLATFELWTMYTLPNGSQFGPVYGQVDLNLPGGWSAISGRLTQYIDESMPSGNYFYKVYVGVYPSDIWASDSFSFEKRSASQGWYVQNSGTNNYIFDVFFTGADEGWAVGFEILHTTDGGDNWYPQEEPSPAHFYGVHFIDNQIGWAVGDLSTILHTTDGGENWTIQETGYPGGYYFNGVYFFNANKGWAVGGFPAGISPPKRVIIHTTNGGNNWETQYWQSQFSPFNAVYFVDSINGWVVGQGGAIFNTTNGGINWNQQTSGTNLELNGIHFVNASVGWVVGRDGTLLHTTDGGTTWDIQNSGTTDFLSDIFFIDAYSGWIAGGATGHATVLHTTDGGATWNSQEPTTTNPLWSINFIDDNLGWAVGAYGTIIHTETGGSLSILEERNLDRLSKNLSMIHIKPNPFNQKTNIRFNLPLPNHVSLKVFNSIGQEIAVLIDSEMGIGEHSIVFDTRNLPLGIYLLKLEAGIQLVTEKLLLVR